MLPLAGAVSAIAFATQGFAAQAVEEQAVEESTTEEVIEEVVANPTDILTDGWTINGYVRTGWRITEKGFQQIPTLAKQTMPQQAPPPAALTRWNLLLAR